MLEVLFAIGVAILAAVVVMWFLKLILAVLWLPLQLVGWIVGIIGTIVGAAVCLLLLPFAIAVAVLGLLVSIVFNPVILLAIIGVMAWMMHRSHRDNLDHHARLPDATNGA